MKIPFTRKELLDWSGERVFSTARTLFEKNQVLRVEYEPPEVHGEIIYGNRTMVSRFRLLDDGTAENMCPCYDSRERGIICIHVVALGLELIRRNSDPLRAQKAVEEKRRASRLAAFDESEYIKRVPADTPGSTPATINLTLADGWREGVAASAFPLLCNITFNEKTMPLHRAPTDTPFAFERRQQNLLYVLEDICEGPARGALTVKTSDMINILQLLPGYGIGVEPEGVEATVNAAVMSSSLKLGMDYETGNLTLAIHTELPFSDDSRPVYIIGIKEGVVYQAGNFWPLSTVLPGPLRDIYFRDIVIPRARVPAFLQTELPLLENSMRIDTDITPDLFALEPGEPRFKLVVRGSPASIAANLYAIYGDNTVTAARPDPAGSFAEPDPEDMFRYMVRNQSAEERAIQHLELTGFQHDETFNILPIVGCREVLNFLGSGIPRLRRLGWKIELTGPIENEFDGMNSVIPVVNVDEHEESGCFDVAFSYETTDGSSLTDAEIQRAILKGESFVERGNRTLLIDADAVSSAREVFTDCSTQEGASAGAFRMNSIFAAYVKSSLDALDGVDVESDRRWQTRAEQQNRTAAMEPVELPENIARILRPYQADGIAWLRFLERNRFCGILADDMGLGKTLQALTWIQLARSEPDASGHPALIVCPTSLAENWKDEAERFFPGLKAIILSGSERHRLWDEIPETEMVITSYALMRRDVEKHLNLTYSVVILDEAQHIKNRSTQNAVSAKQLKAYNRLVLTGTPMENSVADLWSIMDFLMPGYLGPYDMFRMNYELPVSHGGPEAEIAHAKLRRKLHPFLLRRLKKDVAKDLPPKIERIASCRLTRDQESVYKNLLEVSQRKVSSMVADMGFNRSRMEILKMIMRLRQTCCHLDLLKLPDLESKFPSGKTDLFFELLDEAIDGGHRVLVFSQFTSMLAILRKEMESRNLALAYLDGSTKHRQSVVREFNLNRDIPVFLMSLKAGGTGLNITGADMVIHFDPWWNPAVEDQATDRAHRIGQKKTVYSVKLITRGTIEEKVLEMQRRKQHLIDATLKSDDETFRALNWDDIQELLEL